MFATSEENMAKASFQVNPNYLSNRVIMRRRALAYAPLHSQFPMVNFDYEIRLIKLNIIISFLD